MKEFLIDQIITLGAENMPKDYAQPLAYGDKLAHRWRVTVRDGKGDTSLAGCTAMMYFARQDWQSSHAKLGCSLLYPTQRMRGEFCWRHIRQT